MTITFNLNGTKRYVSQVYAHTIGHSVDPKRAIAVRDLDLNFVNSRIRSLGGTNIEQVN